MTSGDPRLREGPRLVCDLVIKGGLVIDPETGPQEVRDVGISRGVIDVIERGGVVGERSIDATGRRCWSVAAGERQRSTTTKSMPFCP